jgi:hypothetical protein
MNFLDVLRTEKHPVCGVFVLNNIVLFYEIKTKQ